MTSPCGLMVARSSGSSWLYSTLMVMCLQAGQAQGMEPAGCGGVEVQLTAGCPGSRLDLARLAASAGASSVRVAGAARQPSAPSPAAARAQSCGGGSRFRGVRRRSPAVGVGQTGDGADGLLGLTGHRQGVDVVVVCLADACAAPGRAGQSWTEGRAFRLARLPASCSGARLLYLTVPAQPNQATRG